MNKSIAWALVFAISFMGLAALLGYFENLGVLSHETVDRTIQIVIGLGLAVYSNFTPKQIGKAGSPQAEAWKASVLRVTGWSMALAGLAYAGLWAFAPMTIANIASVAVVMSALVLTVGYSIRAAIACRTLAAD